MKGTLSIEPPLSFETELPLVVTASYVISGTLYPHL
jgi:hypothetical protein